MNFFRCLLILFLAFTGVQNRLNSGEMLYECSFETPCTDVVSLGNQLDSSTWVVVMANGRGIRLNTDHTMAANHSVLKAPLLMGSPAFTSIRCAADYVQPYLRPSFCIQPLPKGHYLRMKRRGRATFTLSKVQLTFTKGCLSLWEHVTSGSRLEVTVTSTLPASRNATTTIEGEDRKQTQQWRLCQIDLAGPGTVQVKVVGTKNKGSADVSVDDLSLTSGPCNDISQSIHSSATSAFVNEVTLPSKHASSPAILQENPTTPLETHGLPTPEVIPKMSTFSLGLSPISHILTSSHSFLESTPTMHFIPTKSDSSNSDLLSTPISSVGTSNHFTSSLPSAPLRNLSSTNCSRMISISIRNKEVEEKTSISHWSQSPPFSTAKSNVNSDEDNPRSTMVEESQPSHSSNNQSSEHAVFSSTVSPSARPMRNMTKTSTSMLEPSFLVTSDVYESASLQPHTMLSLSMSSVSLTQVSGGIDSNKPLSGVSKPTTYAPFTNRGISSKPYSNTTDSSSDVLISGGIPSSVLYSSTGPKETTSRALVSDRSSSGESFLTTKETTSNIIIPDKYRSSELYSKTKENPVHSSMSLAKGLSGVIHGLDITPSLTLQSDQSLTFRIEDSHEDKTKPSTSADYAHTYTNIQALNDLSNSINLKSKHHISCSPENKEFATVSTMGILSFPTPSSSYQRSENWQSSRTSGHVNRNSEQHTRSTPLLDDPNGFPKQPSTPSTNMDGHQNAPGFIGSSSISPTPVVLNTTVKIDVKQGNNETQTNQSTVLPSEIVTNHKRTSTTQTSEPSTRLAQKISSSAVPRGMASSGLPKNPPTTTITSTLAAPQDDKHEWVLPVVLVMGFLILVLFVLVIIMLCKRRINWPRTRRTNESTYRPYSMGGSVKSPCVEDGNSRHSLDFVHQTRFQHRDNAAFDPSESGHPSNPGREMDPSIKACREMIEMDAYKVNGHSLGNGVNGHSLGNGHTEYQRTNVTHFGNPDPNHTNNYDPYPYADPNNQKPRKAVSPPGVHRNDAKSPSGLWLDDEQPRFYYDSSNSVDGMRSPTPDATYHRRVYFHVGDTSTSSFDKNSACNSPTENSRGRTQNKMTFSNSPPGTISNRRDVAIGAPPLFNKAMSVSAIAHDRDSTAKQRHWLRHNTSLGSTDPYREEYLSTQPFNKFETRHDLVHVDDPNDIFLFRRNSASSAEGWSSPYYLGEDDDETAGMKKIAKEKSSSNWSLKREVTNQQAYIPVPRVSELGRQKNGDFKTDQRVPSESTSGVVTNASSTVSQSPIKSIPKIVLSKPKGDDTEKDNEMYEDSSNHSNEFPKKPRRIARANNPFMIEIDPPFPSFGERTRRLSAPTISSTASLESDAAAIDPIGGTQHVSSHMNAVPLNMRGNPVDNQPDLSNLHSWSTDFCEFIKHIDTKESSKEQVGRFKKMIDERYDLLLGRKYSDLDKLHLWDPPQAFPGNLSPRFVKRPDWKVTEPDLYSDERQTLETKSSRLDNPSFIGAKTVSDAQYVLLKDLVSHKSNLDEIEKEHEQSYASHSVSSDAVQEIPSLTMKRAGPYGQERDEENDKPVSIQTKAKANHAPDMSIKDSTNGQSVNDSKEVDKSEALQTNEQNEKPTVVRDAKPKIGVTGKSLSLPLISKYRPRRSGVLTVLPSQHTRHINIQNLQPTSDESPIEITPIPLNSSSPVDPIYESIPSVHVSSDDSPEQSGTDDYQTDENGIYEKIDDAAKVKTPEHSRDTKASDRGAPFVGLKEEVEKKNELNSSWSRFDSLPPSPPPMRSPRHPLRRMNRVAHPQATEPDDVPRRRSLKVDSSRELGPKSPRESDVAQIMTTTETVSSPVEHSENEPRLASAEPPYATIDNTISSFPGTKENTTLDNCFLQNTDSSNYPDNCFPRDDDFSNYSYSEICSLRDKVILRASPRHQNPDGPEHNHDNSNAQSLVFGESRESLRQKFRSSASHFPLQHASFDDPDQLEAKTAVNVDESVTSSPYNDIDSDVQNNNVVTGTRINADSPQPIRRYHIRLDSDCSLQASSV